MTNFTSSSAHRRSRLAQSMRCASPLPGHLTSMILTTPAARWRRSMSARLDQHGLARGRAAPHQRIDLFLQERLAAGHLNQRAADSRSTAAITVVQRHLPALVKGVRRVAPRAAQVAGRQAHEHTGPPGMRRLALDRVKDFVDGQHGNSDYRLRLRTTDYDYGLQTTGHGLQAARSYNCCHAPHRHLRVELPHRQGHLERRLLPSAAGTRSSVQGLRRALVLRRALRHGRSELELLRAAAARGEPRLGGADADADSSSR